MDVGHCAVTRGGCRAGRIVRGAEGQGGRAGEGRAHQHHRAKDIGADERAPGGDRRAEIMADDGRDAAPAERRHETEHVSREIEEPEGAKIPIVIGVPAGGAAIAALIGGDHMEARGGERQHHLSPGIGDLGKAMQKKNQGTVLALRPASSTCRRSPLMPSMKRARMPRGSVSLARGANSVTHPLPLFFVPRSR